MLDVMGVYSPYIRTRIWKVWKVNIQVNINIQMILKMKYRGHLRNKSKVPSVLSLVDRASFPQALQEMRNIINLTDEQVL
jgi:hypothetical protein